MMPGAPAGGVVGVVGVAGVAGVVDADHTVLAGQGFDVLYHRQIVVRAALRCWFART